MRKSIIFIIAIGIVGMLTYCKKEGAQAVMSAAPVVPTIVTLPDLTLQRTHGTDSVVFTGTAVEAGFNSAVSYYLEADTAGNNFLKPVILATGISDAVFKFSISDLDAILIKRFPLDTVSSIEIRIRSVIATSGDPFVYLSPTKTATLATYGPPALYLTTDGVRQSITSPSDNLVYSGWIYTDGTPFTLLSNGTGKTYGSSDGAVLTENGNAITLPTGAYTVVANLATPGNLTFASANVTMGIIGDAVGGWSNDTHMTYSFSDHSWNINMTVTAGGIKFRTTGTWNSYNVAYRPGKHDLNNLYQSHGKLVDVIETDLGDSQNIDDIAPGNYDIKLFLETTPWKAVFTPTAK